MKSRELAKLGYPKGAVMNAALAAAGNARMSGRSNQAIRGILRDLLRAPGDYTDDPLFGKVAAAVIEAGLAPAGPPHREYRWNEGLQYAVWGDEIDPEAHRQMANACRLPISVAGALMPDAHVGYGLPIGGVLATEGAVIPYAVGVDIACRMMLTVFDLPPQRLAAEQDRFERVLEGCTRFGVGAEWKPRRDHPVMDQDWKVAPVTARLKDLAHRQLGTSGSGNHFVEFGEIVFERPALGAPAGSFAAVLSHSGSRGPGNQVATEYSRRAMALHRGLPRDLRHLAWLDLDGDGAEYWAAMELMGAYASANHHVIHRQIAAAVGADVIAQVENHHNFAWRESHVGREVVVHRKGATPARAGAVGIIPGSMASPAYVVEGLGDPRSLESASHGAGRVLSRTAAVHKYRWRDVLPYLQARGVKVLSAGLDEVPMVYKDIDRVMAAQTDLVRPLARFMPRLVKMAPAGERPED